MGTTSCLRPVPRARCCGTSSIGGRIGGITPKVLTDTLRSMERDGLITRDQAPGVPPRVDYALTPLGSTLAEPMNALRIWAEGHAEEILDNRVRYDAVVLDSAR